MAVLALKSAQLVRAAADNPRLYPTEDHGKFRQQYANFVNDSGAAGDAGSTVDLFVLPPGKLSLRPLMAALRCSAFGASRVVKIGHRKYYKSSTEEIAEDDDAFSTGLDISAAALVTNPYGTQLKYDLYSMRGITVYATVTGGTIPTNATLETYLPYIYE